MNKVDVEYNNDSLSKLNNSRRRGGGRSRGDRALVKSFDRFKSACSGRGHSTSDCDQFSLYLMFQPISVCFVWVEGREDNKKKKKKKKKKKERKKEGRRTSFDDQHEQMHAPPHPKPQFCAESPKPNHDFERQSFHQAKQFPFPHKSEHHNNKHE